MSPARSDVYLGASGDACFFKEAPMGAGGRAPAGKHMRPTRSGMVGTRMTL